MLIAALGLTVLGFAFLVAAVATGQIAWAWACIVVGALGLVVLVVDLVRGRGDRNDHGDRDDRNREPAADPDAADARTGG